MKEEDLNKIQQAVDHALSNESEESLSNWLSNKRKHEASDQQEPTQGEDIQRYDLTDDPIMETSNTGGWYKVSDVESIIAQRDELLLAIQGAMRIVDLWKPPTSTEAIEECHIGEFAALAMMRQSFEKALKG